MWIILIAVVAGIIVWAYIAARMPLTPDEVERLVSRRLFTDVEKQLGLVRQVSFVNQEFKSAMAASGRFYAFNTPLSQFPSVAAALLKGKKHEWIVIGLARQGTVVGVWMNKGPNSKTVWALMSNNQIYQLAQDHAADTIVDIHNHPNSNPARYTTAMASPQDALSANHCGEFYSRRGLRFIGIVAERGNFHLYACWIPPQPGKSAGVRAEIAGTNGTSGDANFSLRSELRRQCELELSLGQVNSSHNLHYASAAAESVKTATEQPPSIAVHPSVLTPAIRDSTPAHDIRPTRKTIPVQLPVPMTVVASSHLAEVGYSDHEKILFVRFRRGGIYRYFGVEPELFRELLAAPSKGSFFQSRVVSGPYRYDRVV